MRHILRAISVCLFMFSTILLSLTAQAAQKKMSQEELMADYTMKTINKAGTVGGLIKMLEPRMATAQVDQTKRTISNMGLAMKSKFPKMRVEGNKVLFDKNNYLIYVDKETINVNGKTFKGTGQTIPNAIETVYSGLKQKSASFGLIPEAHAMDLMPVLGVLGGGALGAFLGNASGIGAGMGALLGVGAVYAGTWLYQSLRNGEVSCADDGSYSVRQMSAGGMFLGSSTQQSVPTTMAAGACGGVPVSCNSSNAKQVGSFLRDNNNISANNCGAPGGIQPGTTITNPDDTYQPYNPGPDEVGPRDTTQ